MKREFENEWERELDTRLKGLPEMKAPMDLLANVMGAIEKRQSLAWYRRPYYTWSSSLKFGGAFALALLGTTFALGSYYGLNAVSTSSAIAGIGEWFSSLFGVLDGLSGSLTAIGRTVLGKYALGILLAASLFYGVIIGAGSFVYKIMRQKMEGGHVA